MTTEILLADGARELGLELGEQVVSLLSRYCDELRRWNRRINLVARKSSLQEIIDKHFLDSLTLLSLLDPDLPKDGAAGGLLDVGTGAGFPGLVLAVARQELEVVLVEPRQKRVAFLRHIVRTLHLANVRIVPSRLEEATDFTGHGFSFVTSRAVAEPALLLSMVEPVLSSSTRIILMLGPNSRRLWPDAGMPGYAMIGERICRLPLSGAVRHLVVLKPATESVA